jgi:DNA adenine methylase
MTPFLRWAGGKRWLSPRLAPLLQTRLSGSYVEPFLGAGAVYFAVQPRKAVLSDINADLINAYNLVAKDSSSIIKLLKQIPVSQEAFYAQRESKPRKSNAKAARFIYLNRTCYGGLHRANAQGKFNTPYGGGSRTTEILWKRSLLDQAGALLRSRDIIITARDFEQSMASAIEGDVVYCDPVYASHDRREFDRY